VVRNTVFSGQKHRFCEVKELNGSSGWCPYGQKLNKIYPKSNRSTAWIFVRFGKICSISARKGTPQTLKSKIHGFSKKRHLRGVPIGVFTRSDGIYKWMVTAERDVDDCGTGVSIVWNDPKQSLRKHYVGSTWVQNRL